MNNKGMGMYDVLELSLYAISYCIKKGKPISNLKLQKILYYIQGAYLVYKDKPCFNEKIVRGSFYGPYIQEVNSEFRSYSYKNITEEQSFDRIAYDKVLNKLCIEKVTLKENYLKEEDKILIDKVIDSYINVDIFDIVNKSKNELPWINTEGNNEIELGLIKNYYSKNKSKLYFNK